MYRHRSITHFEGGGTIRSWAVGRLSLMDVVWPERRYLQIHIGLRHD